MTAETDLLPLPEYLQRAYKMMAADSHEAECKQYARANVAHATAPLQAEIEALREDVASWKDQAMHNLDLIERLAEALRGLVVDMERAQANMRNAAKTDPRWEGCAESIQPRVDAARAALRDHDQEGKDG